MALAAAPEAPRTKIEPAMDGSTDHGQAQYDAGERGYDDIPGQGLDLVRPGILFGCLQAHLTQVRIKGLAQLSGLLVAVVVRDEVLYRPDDAVRPGLVVFPDHAELPGLGQVAGAFTGGVSPQALVARRPEVLLGLRAEVENLAEATTLSPQGERGLHHVALLFVLGLHVSTRIQGLVGIEVLGGVARVVTGHNVLHEHPTVAGLPLPVVRNRVARL